MKNILKILGLIIFILQIILLVLLISADFKPHIAFDFIGWIIMLPYFIIVITTSVFKLRKKQHRNPWLESSINGSFIGGGIALLIVYSGLIITGFRAFSDGTALWADVWLPIVFFGYPLIIIGAIIGLIAQKIISR